MSQDTIVGIDLGTTNSEVAIVENGQPRVLLGDDGDPILPSFVGLSEDGKLLVGKAARNQYIFAPERTIKSIKRKMGQDVRVKLADQEYRPQEISAMILRALKDRAEKALNKPITKAVITVPAYFNDSQRQATIEAGQLAGLEVKRILNEPTAAALTYDPQQTNGMRVLVYDLGGGTFDVSIVQTEAGVVEVLASHGDTQLGGDDFDELLFNHICERFQSQHQVDLRENPISKARVLRAAETAKKQLSDFESVRVEEEFIAEKDGVPIHLNLELERTMYESLIQPLILRTLDCVQRSLDDANLTARQIDRVVLVCGSTRTPLISTLLEQRLGRPAHREINPDLCVAMGASVQGAIIAGENVGAVLVDITPHSLGIRCVESMGPFGREGFDFKFAPILHRGTPLPASRSEVFATCSHNQAVVNIDIYQGESSDVRRNHEVGKFKIEGLARVPAGNKIVVQLDLNLDGVLKVTAKEKATGLQKNITIENTLSRMSAVERSVSTDRLDRLWQAGIDENRFQEMQENDAVNPELRAELQSTLEQMMNQVGVTTDEMDDDESDYDELDGDGMDGDGMEAIDIPVLEAGPREGQRETVQARALIEKAERLRSKAAPEDQADLDRLTENVRNALTERKWAEVETASNALADVLFYLEDA